jgi:seryl-tRNA synthetase
MLEISLFRNEAERLKVGLLKKNPQLDVDNVVATVLDLDDKRRSVQTKLDSLLSDVNRISKEIGDLFKSGKQAEASKKKEDVANIKLSIENLQTEHDSHKKALHDLIVTLPNVANESVKAGQSETDNEIFKDWSGTMPALHDKALPHWELGEKYNLFSLPLGVQITGAGFPLYLGQGARLQRALISFFLDEGLEAGYLEIMPPLLVNEASAYSTGQLPDKEGQMYYIEKDDLYLIPTAEVPITNIYRDKIIPITDLPIKLTGHTPCFRREAGSYGADVKGLNRVHQFDKVEIVQMTKQEDSYAALEDMVAHVEAILNKLKLPYRILRLCGGDTSFASAITYDFEVYSGAQGKWLEVSSVSNFETFQSNRLMTRYKDEKGTNVLVHTLNGSALALARIVASILENVQTPDGSEMPEVLRPYTGFDIIN